MPVTQHLVIHLVPSEKFAQLSDAQGAGLVHHGIDTLYVPLPSQQRLGHHGVFHRKRSLFHIVPLGQRQLLGPGRAHQLLGAG